MIRISTLLTVLAVVLGMGLAIVPRTAEADDPGEAATTLKVEAAAMSKAPGQYVLGVKLTGVDGAPLSEREVAFYQTVDLFGPRSSYLGSAITDATGVATLRYDATMTGAQTFVARFAGAQGLAKSESSTQFHITQTKAAFEEPPLPYGLVGQWLPYALGALVLGVWLTIAGLLLRTVVGIRTAVRAPRLGKRSVLSPLASHSSEAGGGS